MLLIRHVFHMAAHLFRFGTRSGLWWVAVMIPLLALAALLMATAKTVVPTTLYVFF